MIVGRVQQIWRYAVKSMAGEKLAACEVGSKGIPGDRGWAVRDETRGEITNGKRIPLLMQCSATYRSAPAAGLNTDAEILLSDGTVTATDDSEVHSHLSRVFGKLFDPDLKVRVSLSSVDKSFELYPALFIAL